MAAPIIVSRFGSVKLIEKLLFPLSSFNNFCREISTQLILDPEISEKIEKDEMKLKAHPGIMNIKTVKLPNALEEAITSVIKIHSLKDLENKSKDLVKYLNSRKQPVDNDEIKIYSQELSKQLELERGSLSDFPLEMQEGEIEERKIKIEKCLRSRLYHWKPIDYNFYRGILYTFAKMAPNYAVLSQIFSEIKQRDSHFQPKTLLDFGSGVGTTVWAAHSFWGNSLKEYVCIDSSSDMNMISDLLLRGGKETNEPMCKHVFYKQYLPSSDVLKYNIVVSAFSLLDLPSIDLRLQTLSDLWRKTEDYLVIIENGTIEGFKTVLEARDFVHHLQQTKQMMPNKDPNFHVFAPCPHDLECPRYKDGLKASCNFEVNYFPYKLTKNVVAVKERFSYVVFKKAQRSSEVAWPRIVRPLLLRHKHAVCRLCTSEGCLKDITITAAKHGKLVYKVARSSKWGDLIPFTEIKESSKKTKEANKDDDIS